MLMAAKVAFFRRTFGEGLVQWSNKALSYIQSQVVEPDEAWGMLLGVLLYGKSELRDP